MDNKNELQRICPQKAIEILRKDGLVVSSDEAKIILEFLYQMAEVVVDQYLKEVSQTQHAFSNANNIS